MIIRHQPGARLSHAVEYPLSGTMVATAGEVADDLAASVAGQTTEVLGKIDRLLSAASADKTQLVGAYIWLADIGDFAAMNAVWEGWVVPGQTPVRACIEAKLADPRIKVEIQVFAVKPA